MSGTLTKKHVIQISIGCILILCLTGAAGWIFFGGEKESETSPDLGGNSSTISGPASPTKKEASKSKASKKSIPAPVLDTLKLQKANVDVAGLKAWYENPADYSHKQLSREVVEKSGCFIPFFGGVESFAKQENEFGPLSNYSHHPVKIAPGDLPSDQDLWVLLGDVRELSFENSENAVHFLKIFHGRKWKNRTGQITELMLREAYAFLSTKDADAGKRYAEQFCKDNFLPGAGQPIISKDDMKLVIRLKYEQNEEVRETLRKTGNLFLIEGNEWRDANWGMVRKRGSYKGENKLGRIWYQFRESLKTKN